MLGEYLVPHDAQRRPLIALVTFGLFFLLLFTAGFVARLEGLRLRSTPLAAVWAAMIASECWFILLLAIYYAFLDTPQEARFLEVDQVIADFQRSGRTDLRAFIFGDYMGAGFFHSLLGPLLAVPWASWEGWWEAWCGDRGRMGLDGAVRIGLSWAWILRPSVGCHRRS